MHRTGDFVHHVALIAQVGRVGDEGVVIRCHGVDNQRVADGERERAALLHSQPTRDLQAPGDDGDACMMMATR